MGKVISKVLGLGICALVVAGIAQAGGGSLMGTWSSKCAADGSGNFNIETFVFSKSTAVYSVKTFKDANCTQKISTLTTNRTYKLAGPYNKLANTSKLDYTFNSVTMEYNDAAAITQANQSKNYGFSDWMLNQPKSVAGMKQTLSATPEHAKGEKFFTIVKIDKNQLFMGDYGSGKGTSEDTRLSAIYNVPFSKETKK